ncbi:schwannomin-interacting protein 1 [Cyprinodon tularosa]|uniref:schwannomin-interacting protein 1 n=1 Tax=Cyprinodon tularosa TaxID=77115 RepID=UPI0018E228D4|nr:schwannomin-interacting protein 1 [Cyprinodon tularosa]XP_038137462.1 schwannomin-interacting protein 1 [Cyprinodon tularosa]
MEGEKGTEEEEEGEEKDNHHFPVDHQELPIMHWEELSQRIAELEKQEEERRKKRRTEDRQGGDWRDVWDKEDLVHRGLVAVAASRLNNNRNLQLCFINNSDTEEEEEEEGANGKVSMGPTHNGCHGAGLKQEVAAALRALRDNLLAEQKQQEESQASSSCIARWKHLERRELQQQSLQQLSSLRASLQQEVHALSSELVAHLFVRDQLRTKQDAMLLDVQDLT